VVKVGPTGTAVIAGRAEPGAKVIVRDGDKAIGEVTADRRGEWVLIPEQPIGSGNRLLSAEASNQQGDATVKSEETVALSISPTAPERAGETALAVVLPREGGHAARVLQLPEGASPGKPNALSMDTAEYDAEGRVVLSGHAAPGATVQVYLGNEPLATVTADAAGAWSATSSRTVPPGQLELRLDQLASSGQVAQRVALPFTQAGAMEPAPAPGQSYVVQRGNNLWRIAQRAYGAGTRYVIIYSANPGQIRNPDKIYPGQIFKIPKS
jgi:nucleoid-associated protein YgaU